MGSRPTVAQLSNPSPLFSWTLPRLTFTSENLRETPAQGENMDHTTSRTETFRAAQSGRGGAHGARRRRAGDGDRGDGLAEGARRTANTPPVPSLTWTDRQGGYECANADVPLDYRDPSGRKITLVVVPRRPLSRRSARARSWPGRAFGRPPEHEDEQAGRHRHALFGRVPVAPGVVRTITAACPRRLNSVALGGT